MSTPLFSLIQAQSNPHRGETVNVGILALRNGRLDVRVGPTAHKRVVRAFSPWVKSAEWVKQSLEMFVSCLHELDATPEAVAQFRGRLANQFALTDWRSFDGDVDAIFDLLVEPASAPTKRTGSRTPPSLAMMVNHLRPLIDSEVVKVHQEIEIPLLPRKFSSDLTFMNGSFNLVSIKRLNPTNWNAIEHLSAVGQIVARKGVVGHEGEGNVKLTAILDVVNGSSQTEADDFFGRGREFLRETCGVSVLDETEAEQFAETISRTAHL